MDVLHPPSPITYPSEWKAGLYCGIASLFFFFEFIQLNMFNALSAGLIDFLKLDASQWGNLSASYMYAMLIGLFPAGLLLDHIDTKKIILVTFLISILGAVGFIYADSFAQAMAARFISGLGGAFAFQSALRVAIHYFAAARLSMVNGMIVAFGMLGGIVAQIPITLLMRVLTWHEVLWVCIGIGVLFWGIIGVGLPSRNVISNITSSFHHSTSTAKIKNVLSNRQTWLASLYTCLLNFPIPLLGATWGNPYLQQVRHLSAIEASTVISFLFFGVIVGCPILGWWSDAVKKRRFPMLWGGLLALVTVLFIIYLPILGKASLCLLFFLLGFFSSAQTIGYSVVTENNPTAQGTALGFASLFIMGGAAVVQPLFGWVMDFFWQGKIIHQVRFYTIDNFNTAMLILPIAFLIGVVIAILLKDFVQNLQGA